MKGRGRSSSALTTLKMVELPPMPSPRMRIAKIVKPASRRKVRKACRRSCAPSLIQPEIQADLDSSDFWVRLPNLRRAALRASCSGMPCSISSRANASTWNSISSRSSSCRSLCRSQ